MFSRRQQPATFIPHKGQKAEPSWRFLMGLHAGASLGVDLQQSVKKPEGVALHEWLAAQVLKLHRSAELCWSMVEPDVPPQMPMTAGPLAEYKWADPRTPDVAPAELPAQQYCITCLAWVKEQIDDPVLFAVGGGAFPSNFSKVVRHICRRLFRVYVHIFHHHYMLITAANFEAHLATSFKHLLFFSREFGGLIPTKELQPLADLIASIDARQTMKDKQ